MVLLMATSNGWGRKRKVSYFLNSSVSFQTYMGSKKPCQIVEEAGCLKNG